MTQAKAFSKWLGGAVETAIDSKLGAIMTDRYWRVESRGGGMLCWSKVAESDKFVAWISLDEAWEAPQECGDLGIELDDPESAQWLCGIYRDGEDWGLVDATVAYCTQTSITAAMDWCETALKMDDPSQMEGNEQ